MIFIVFFKAFPGKTAITTTNTTSSVTTITINTQER